jgi:DNA-binding CsgD family transcriptional regulator
VVSAATRPTVELVVGPAENRAEAQAGLAEAEAADVVRLTGERIDFTHPLLGSTVYAAASTEARRRVHGRLADLVVDPEERARHLALAAPGADPGVAAELQAAARHASARGASDAAAELAELARKVTPPEDVAMLRKRSVDSAVYHFDAGDAMRAIALLDEAIESGRPGPDRAAVVFQLAAISWLDLPRVEALCRQALEETGDDDRLAASIHEHLAWVGLYRGDLDHATDHAEAARAHAGGIDDPATGSEVAATFGMVGFLRGVPADQTMSEALRLQELAVQGAPASEAAGYTPASACYGLLLLWAGRLDESRDLLQRELARFVEQGRYLIRDEFLAYLAEVEVRAGNWELATRCAEEAYEIDLESGRLWGRGHTLFPKALVEAHRGDVEAARADAEEGRRLCELNQDPLNRSCNDAVLGFLELSLSNHAGAIERLEPALAFLDRMASAEPGIIPCLPDAIEALVAVGDLDRADRLLAVHERKGSAMRRPWALATAARCRGLLAAARSDRDSAMAAFERAMEHHARLPMPFELGRTLLALGEVQRRFKQRRAAGGSLRAALEIFESLGAPLWAAKAREGLARIGARVSSGELTPTERRVAELVSEGRTNKEVADALFVSVKTVEANLSRIFHKLGITSRRELRGRERSGDEPGLP